MEHSTWSSSACNAHAHTRSGLKNPEDEQEPFDATEKESEVNGLGDDSEEKDSITCSPIVISNKRRTTPYSTGWPKPSENAQAV